MIWSVPRVMINCFSAALFTSDHYRISFFIDSNNSANMFKLLSFNHAITIIVMAIYDYVTYLIWLILPQTIVALIRKVVIRVVVPAHVPSCDHSSVIRIAWIASSIMQSIGYTVVRTLNWALWREGVFPPRRNTCSRIIFFVF